jgi:protein-tyrosine-phosphatase
MAARPLKVLVLCTGNSARSQMAEALLRVISNGQVEVHSAGSAPQPAVHPLALSTLREVYGLDPDGLHPKPLTQFLGDHFDYVITVCGRAAENCPVFPGAPQRLHWGFDDPAAVVDPVEQCRAFEEVAAGLVVRIREWLRERGLPQASGY